MSQIAPREMKTLFPRDLSDLERCREIGFKSSLVVEMFASDLYEVVFMGHEESILIAGTISPEIWKEQSLCPQNLEQDFTERLTHAEPYLFHHYPL